MEPVSLSLGVVIVALVTKAAGRAGEEAVDGAAVVLTRLVGKLRSRFADRGDDSVVRALELVQAAPDSPSAQGKLAALLDERAETTVAVREELEELVAEAGQTDIQVPSVSQSIENSPGAAQVVGSPGASVSTSIER